MQRTADITKAMTRREMMEEHSSYHNSIPGEEAVRRLKLHGRHCYLTRYSECQKRYILSVYQRDKPNDTIRHFEIAKEINGNYKIEGKDEEFDSIEELLEHYEHTRIHPSLNNIGENCTKEEYDFAEEVRDLLTEEEEEEIRFRQMQADRHKQPEQNGIKWCIIL